MIKKILILITVISIFGCYGGQDVPNLSSKSENSQVAQTDSLELLKELNSKIALVEIDLTLPELETLKSTLEGYKEKTKSIEIIKKINEALEKIEAKITSLKGKEEIAKKIGEIETTYIAISKEKVELPRGNSAKAFENAIEEIKKLLSNLEGIKANIETLIKTIADNYKSEKNKLNDIKNEIEKKIEELLKLLDTAINAKVSLSSKDEIEKNINKKLEVVTKEIGETVAITVLDSSYISFMNNLKATISNTNDINSLDALRIEIIKKEPEINKAIAENNSKIAKISALISEVENLLKEAEKAGLANINQIKNLLSSLVSAKSIAEKDSVQLQNFKNILIEAKKEIIEKINNLKETEFIQELKNEYKKALTTIEPKLSEIEKNINKVKELIEAKETLENEIQTNFVISKDIIAKLENIKKELEVIDIFVYYESLVEAKNIITTLAIKGGKYLDGLDLQLAKIEGLIKLLEETIKEQNSSLETIPDIIENIQETIQQEQVLAIEEPIIVPIISQPDITDNTLKEVYNIILDSKTKSFEQTKKLIKEIKTTIVKEDKKIISKKTDKIKESVKTKYIEVNGKEITFYRVVRKLAAKTETTRQEGTKTITEKIKKYEFIVQPVKKWKIEVLTGENTIVNIYQSILQQGQWTQYKKIKSFTIGTAAYKKLENIGIIEKQPASLEKAKSKSK